MDLPRDGLIQDRARTSWSAAEETILRAVHSDRSHCDTAIIIFSCIACYILFLLLHPLISSYLYPRQLRIYILWVTLEPKFLLSPSQDIQLFPSPTLHRHLFCEGDLLG
jgi:hypothetical protein